MQLFSPSDLYLHDGGVRGGRRISADSGSPGSFVADFLGGVCWGIIEIDSWVELFVFESFGGQERLVEIAGVVFVVEEVVGVVVEEEEVAGVDERWGWGAGAVFLAFFFAAEVTPVEAFLFLFFAGWDGGVSCALICCNFSC